jgi:hypothetical protein
LKNVKRSGKKQNEWTVKGETQKDLPYKSYSEKRIYIPQCYECQGFGHIMADCGNLKNARANFMNASMSDESMSSDFDVQKGKKVAYMAFPTTIQGSIDYGSAEIDGESYKEDSDEGSVKSRNHHVSNDTLIKNGDVRKKCKEILKQLTEAKEENRSLQNLLDSAYKTEKSLKVENNSLMTKLFDTNKICES